MIYGMEEILPKAKDEQWELAQLRIFYRIVVGCDAQNQLIESLLDDYHKLADPDTLTTWAELTVLCDELAIMYSEENEQAAKGEADE